MDIATRKDDHIEICLERRVSSTRNYWDDVRLVHSAVPSRDLEDVELTTELLGRKLSAPLILSSMTGGTRKAEDLNRMLARAAEEHGLGLGIGSQRAGLLSDKHLKSYTAVREFEVPLLLGNLGAPQTANGRGSLKGRAFQFGPEDFERARDMIGAHAVCLHLNYLQEAVQPEGETWSSGLFENLRLICRRVMIVAKETGAGISRASALSLKEVGVCAIDIGGMSGTTFAGVESYRNDPTGRAERLGRTFWDWGIPAPASLIVANVGLPMIATGGLRNGLDAARSLALGASAGGMAWTMLKAASRGYESLSEEIGMVLNELRAAVFLSGAGSVGEMGKAGAILTGETREIVSQLAPGWRGITP